MSSIAVTASNSGTGTVSLVAPVTNTDRTITLPDSTGTVQTVDGVLTQFNATGSAPVYACRAWVNFNGTGTVAIRASGNVSSITDNGVGNYTVNFATAMPDVNYAVSFTARSNTGSFFGWAIKEGVNSTGNTGAIESRGLNGTVNPVAYDATEFFVSIFR